MNTIKVYAKPGAKLPTKTHKEDACWDVYSHEILEITDRHIIVRTGLYVEFSTGYELLVRPRSSITKYDVVLHNAPATIDSPYRGEIILKFYRLHSLPFSTSHLMKLKSQLNIAIKSRILEAMGFRPALTTMHDIVSEYLKVDEDPDFYAPDKAVAQITLKKVEDIEWKVVDSLDDLSNTARGTSGFGSTDKV